MLQKEDFIKYNKFACAKLTQPNVGGIKPFLVNLAIWMVVSVLFFTIFQSTGFSIYKFHWPTAVATSFPFLIFTAVFFLNLKKMQSNSMPKENGLMLGKRTIQFDDSGIKDVNSLCTSVYKWEALDRIVKHDGNVYIFLDTMQAQILPSSSFSSINEMEEFVENVEIMHNKSGTRNLLF